MTGRNGTILVVVAIVATVTQFSAGAAATLHYKLDETSAGPVVNSAGGTINDGENNGAAFDPTGQAGQIGGAYSFDGTNGHYVDANTTTLIPATDDFTVLMWINTTSEHSTQGHLLGNSKSGAAGRANLMVQNSKFGFYLDGFGEFYFDTNIDDGTWHHVGATRSGNAFSFIIDGSIHMPFGTSSANVGDTGVDWRLGARASNSDQFQYDGSIDDVGVWQGAITATRVAATYGLGLFSDVDLGDSAIDAILAMDTSGQEVTDVGADLHTWAYATGLSGTAGSVGGSVTGGDAWIVLGDSGQGVQFVPEPASAMLVFLGFGAVASRRRRRACLD